ncbi:MAG: hypothetical protein OEV66_01900 [Spirochaetia bacterium]|nr:hypothetical protein [Spirochaetia bacterium]
MEKNPGIRVLKTRVAKLTMGQDGLTHMILDHKDGLTVDDLKEILSAISTLTGGEKAIVFSKSLNFKTPSHQVRTVAAAKESAEVVKAVATVAANPIIRVAANFFLKISKPPFPFKTFTDEKEAILWLKSFQA